MESFSSASKSQLRTFAHILPELSISLPQASVSHASRCLVTRHPHHHLLHHRGFILDSASRLSILPYSIDFAVGWAPCFKRVSERGFLYHKLGFPRFIAGKPESSKQCSCLQDPESSLLPSSTPFYHTNHSQTPFSSPNHSTRHLCYCLPSLSLYRIFASNF